MIWPESDINEKSFRKLSDTTITDLELDEIIDAISISEKQKEFNHSVITTLCDDPDVIDYRLDILDDFVKFPALEKYFLEIIRKIDDLENYIGPNYASQPPLLKAVKRLRELDIYSECIRKVETILHDIDIDFRSKGLKALKEYLSKLVEEDSYIALEDSIKEFTPGDEQACQCIDWS